MKAIWYFKLAVLTGFAALGLLAAGVAHAQAPSGPITAAAAQPAHGPGANAQNFGATAPAADNHSWRLEVQPGRQRRPAQEEAGLPRFERRLRWRSWTHGWGVSRRWARGLWRAPRWRRKR